MDVHALSHVTGGGLAANLARVLPQGVLVTVDRATWTPPPIFGLVQELGRVPQSDLERTLNMGVGFVAVLPETAVDRALDLCSERDLPAWVMGRVSDAADVAADPGHEVVRGAKGVDGGSVQLVGAHRV